MNGFTTERADGRGEARIATAVDVGTPFTPLNVHRRDGSRPPVLDLPQAAAMLGLGRITAYRLVAQERWPTPVLRLGRLIKVPTQPLLELLRGVRRPVAISAERSMDAARASMGPAAHRG